MGIKGVGGWGSWGGWSQEIGGWGPRVVGVKVVGGPGVVRIKEVSEWGSRG